MNQKLNLQIDKPCSEKLDGFSKTSKSAFCNSCQKEVIDFTKMSDMEIINYFNNEKENTCGRFSKSQMKEYAYNPPVKERSRISFLSTGIISFSLLSLLPISYAQSQEHSQSSSLSINQEGEAKTENKSPNNTNDNHKVNGTIFCEGEPIPFVSVVLKGSKIGTTSDFDGKFQFPDSLKAGDILLFSSVGFRTKEYVVLENAPVEVNMIMEFLDDVFIMGEVSVNTAYSSTPSFWKKVKTWFR